jgi:hypothetical protein
MIHTIKISVLYVGIIAAIQEHAYDHFHGNMSRACLHVSEPIGSHTKEFCVYLNMFDIGSKREGDSKSGSEKSQNVSTISRMVLEVSKTLPVIQWKCWNGKKSNRCIYEKSGMHRSEIKPRGVAPWAIVGSMGPNLDVAPWGRL